MGKRQCSDPMSDASEHQEDGADASGIMKFSANGFPLLSAGSTIAVLAKAPSLASTSR